MIARRLAAILVGFAAAAIAGAAWAQSNAEPRKSLIDRLDDFGKTIFDGILPPAKSESKATPKTDSRLAARQPSTSDGSDLDAGDSSMSDPSDIDGWPAAGPLCVFGAALLLLFDGGRMPSKIVLPKLSSRSRSVFLGRSLCPLCPGRAGDGGNGETHEDGGESSGDHGYFPPNLRRQHPYITELIKRYRLG